MKRTTRKLGGEKQSREKRIRPVLILVPTLVIAALIMGAGTVAWFVSYDGKINPFASKEQKMNIELVDIFDESSISPPGPNQSFAKTVSATNTGDIPGFVRLLVEPTIFSSNTMAAVPLPSEIGTVILLDIDTTNWMRGEDGYYYYLHVLNPGETAPPLFTEVTMGTLEYAYVKGSMKIEVKCEAVDYYKWNYRNSWWADPLNPPTTGSLGTIETTLSALAKD